MSEAHATDSRGLRSAGSVHRANIAIAAEGHLDDSRATLPRLRLQTGARLDVIASTSWRGCSRYAFFQTFSIGALGQEHQGDRPRRHDEHGEPAEGPCQPAVLILAHHRAIARDQHHYDEKRRGGQRVH